MFSLEVIKKMNDDAYRRHQAQKRNLSKKIGVSLNSSRNDRHELIRRLFSIKTASK